MKEDEHKTKEQLIDEVAGLHQRVAELKASDTERKRAEEALWESERRYRLLAEHATDVIWTMDMDLRFTYLSPSVTDMLGYSVEEAMAQTLEEVLTPTSFEVARKALAEALAIAEPEDQLELELNRKDGSTVWTEIKMAFLRDPDGQPVGILGVARDITERKGAEQTLRRAHDELEIRVQERTAELTKVNEELRLEITERKRAEKALRQRNRELALINRASQAFTSTLDLDQVLDATLEEVRRLLDVSAYSVWLIDPVTDELICRQATGPKGEIVRGWRLALGEGIAGWVAQNGESLVVPDTRADEHHFKGVNQQTGLELRSILGVPLRVKENVIGVLEMVDIEVDRFTPAALRLVEPLAAAAATAIENARLYEQAQQEITERKRMEKELTRLSSAVKASVDSIVIIDIEGKIVDVNEATLKMYGADDKGDLIGQDSLNLLVPEYRERGLAGIETVLETGYDMSRGYESITKDGRRIPVELSAAIMKDEGGKPVGIVIIGRDITEHKRAEEELRQSYTKLQRTLEGTILTLVATVEMRDPYTAGHQQRVAQLACAIATEMAMSKERIEGLRMAGLIHDIGKINIPAEILSKPSQLSDLEWGIIKAHSQTGYDILKIVDFPQPVAQIVLEHHERLGGSGYPAALLGGEIMLEARILAVADVVEAMASHRPYRPPRGLDKALEEIAQNRGILYDPEVVDVCLKLFSEGRFKFE